MVWGRAGSGLRCACRAPRSVTLQAVPLFSTLQPTLIGRIVALAAGGTLVLAEGEEGELRRKEVEARKAEVENMQHATEKGLNATEVLQE